MPALMVKRPSVAPASSVGTTGTPGHICALTASTGPTISRESGGGGESVGSCVGVILILSFAMTRASVFCTSATGSPGRMRQFTVARALGQGVGRVTRFEHGGDAGGPKCGVVQRGRRQPRDCLGIGRVAQDRL